MKNIFSMLFMVVILSTMTLPSQAIQPRISNTEEKGNETRSEGNTEVSNVVTVGHIKSYFAKSCKILGIPSKGEVCVCKPLISIQFVKNTCFFVSKTILAAEHATQDARNKHLNFQRKLQKITPVLKPLTKKISNAEFIGDVCNPDFSVE